ncbi:hypothetical protein QVD17_31388 [Tagetes erecta]|uniref:DUF674 domain-containing protein n=1 Tax=Tagetes erecta TaxID=13708 RepID=A0AAD8NGY8_TARER|nr:hypothetical protein QVD17_31388 [Tagetes erecta]
MTNSVMTLKLLVNKQDRQVIFAEADKDFVDFLFYILTLPIGVIPKLTAKEPLEGSLGDLYQSIVNLNNKYMLPNKTKDTILNPKSSTNVPGQDLFSIQKDIPTINRNYYKCSYRCPYVSNVPNAWCDYCDGYMKDELKYVVTESAEVANGEDGIVQEVVTYMVLDNLTMAPMSVISTMTLLDSLSIKDVSVLEEKEVQFGTEEGLKLLKASLVCKNVFTHVFLNCDDQVKII